MSEEKSAFRAKIETIGVMNLKGQKRERPVINDDNGKVVGKHVDHWDDRVDAVATAPTIQMKMAKSEEKYD